MGLTVLTDAQVLKIYSLYPSIGVEAIAKKYNIGTGRVIRILRGDSFKHIKRPPKKIAAPNMILPLSTREALIALHTMDAKKWNGLELAKVFNLHYNTVYKHLRRFKRLNGHMVGTSAK